MCSTGERVTAEQLQPFEGLVCTTARMFASQVKREEGDLAQELRVRVWRAIASHDPARSRLTLERYVFSAITNKIKDYKRDAAREARRREDNGLSFLHIEDMPMDIDEGRPQERFDCLYNFVPRDDVYGMIDGGKFVVPAGVTEREADVLVMMMMEMSRAEIALRLGIEREGVDVAIDALRDKFADWRPGTGRLHSDPGRHESTAQAVRAEDQLIGSRAA